MGGESSEERRLRLQYEEESRAHSEALQREYEYKVQLHQRMMERQLEENDRRNKLLLQSAQKDLDNKTIKNILILNKKLGYNVNPYNMSSSQLQNCYDKMWTEFNYRYGLYKM